MKIMLKIKIIKKYLKIFKNQSLCVRSLLTITIAITNKTLITSKTLTEEKKQTIMLTYYNQTIKRLPCLICCVNIAFIKGTVK